MAKINPIFGKFQGKVGGTVFAIRNGEQILREYNPAPRNPSTPAQVAARARLKLLSQLSAVMAPVIAIPRDGAVSSRNLFVKANYAASSFAEDEASISLTSVKITKSVVAMPPISVTASNDKSIAYIRPAGRVGTLDVNRVVYAMFEKQADSALRFIGTAVATSEGVDRDWPANFPAVTSEVVVYAYGVRDNTQAARAIFGDMEAVSGETIAQLVVSRALTETDVTLTETVGWQGIPQQE